MNIILLLISFVEFVRDVSECCEVGYFGESCSYVCPKHCHNNECDRTSGICLSCVTGYYHSENKTCTRCPDNCAACDSDNFCFTCKSGYMGTVCKDVCSNCKADTSCDKITGYCLENCSDGLRGELCDIKCDSKCKSCDRYNLHECTSCEDDESGILCKEDCFSRCLKRLCNDSDESCTYDCLSENWEGKLCNKTCLTDCKERICDITCKEKGKKVLSMFEDNINIIVGIGAGVVGLIALGILWIVVRRRHSCKRSISFCTTSDNKTNSRYSIDQMEGNDDGGDMDSLSEPLNPMKKGLTNLSLPTTSIGNPVECDKVKDDVCNAIEKLGSCDNPIFIGDGHTEEYIASFGPVDTFINGFDVFLKMVWEEQCGKVVVLSSNDAEDRKFDKYFSSKRQHDAFTVACKKVRNFGKTKYRMRVLTVKKQTQKREVAMFHFLTWSDECVPELVSRILDFQKTVNDFSTKLKGPTFVHLSAGENRRATYITLDLLTKLKKSVNEDDVRKCIANLEKHGLEVIFEQIWNLACLANITITSDVDNTKKEIPSNQMNRFGSRSTESVNTAHNSIDASASSASVQQTLCNNKDQKTPKISRFGSKTTKHVKAAHKRIDANANVQQTICNNKDQWTPKTKYVSNSQETEV